MALEDDRVFRQALETAGAQIGVEFFSFYYDAQDMPALAQQVRSFQGHAMTFHGPMRSAELTAQKGAWSWNVHLSRIIGRLNWHRWAVRVIW